MLFCAMMTGSKKVRPEGTVVACPRSLPIPRRKRATCLRRWLMAGFGRVSSVRRR